MGAHDSVKLTTLKIGQRIQAARKDRGLTQRDLASHLGRTPAAISEIERGRVQQIGAIDLYSLSTLLDKPIEYFYGEDYAGREVQDLIAIIRKMPLSSRKDIVGIVQGTLRMQELADLIRSSDDPTQLTRLARDFYTALQPYLESIGRLHAAGKDIQEKLAATLQRTADDLRPSSS